MSYFTGITEPELGLFIDLYELTMAQAYRAGNMNERAHFSLHFRELPPNRNFVLACGQHYAAQLASTLRFPREQVDRLAELETFDDDFLDWLTRYRFSGDIRVMPEGTPVFPHEPILEVDAPVAEAQLLETLLMNVVSTESVLASKAVRMVIAAQGKPVVDFGMRRMHGFDAALRGVRAYRTAGITATSNVLGSLQHGLKANGTMAHSFIQACRDEKEAFRLFAQRYPGTTVLVDTYDSLAGVDKVISLINDEGLDIGAIRLDSGDLAQLSKEARAKLNAAGLTDVRIVISSGLDEWDIRAILANDAPVDAFGVGTRLGVSADAPALDLAYKLTVYGEEPRIKNSPGKVLLPGAKQVWRVRDVEGRYLYDEIGRESEQLRGDPLLTRVVTNGMVTGPAPDPAESRERVRTALTALPKRLLSLDTAETPYEVRISKSLNRLHEQAVAAATPKWGGEL